MVRKVMAGEELLRASGTVAKKLASWLHEQGYITDEQRKEAAEAAPTPEGRHYSCRAFTRRPGSTRGLSHRVGRGGGSRPPASFLVACQERAAGGRAHDAASPGCRGRRRRRERVRGDCG